MVEARLLDSAGRRRSPASMPGYHLGRIPRNKGQRYPADPPRTEEIVAVMRHAGAAREALRLRAARAGVRRRFVPHQLRHAHAIELAREGVPLNIIQRQLGHQNLGVTSIYLQGIGPGEIIEPIHARRPPMIPASAGLDLRR